MRLNIDESGQGREFVFQHGLCGDRFQTAQVCPDTVHRITMECPGHGLSDWSAPSIAGFTDLLAEVIAARGIRPVVGGISMGAAMAMRLAVTRPELVSGLVIARPAWGVDPAPANMAPNAEVGEILARGGSIADLSCAERLAREAPDNLASLKGFFSREPLAQTSELLRKISADGPGVSAADLRALDLPVLVIGHDQDFVHPLELAEELAGMIPGARFVRITSKAENPVAYRAEFRAALEEFLHKA